MVNKFVAVGNINELLISRLIPAITVWNRLECRPRTDNFDRALAAEVRDPLWMLTKQWQMGEFLGDDAGSPVFSKIYVDTTRLTKYQPGEKAVQPFTDELPLEAKVEQRHIPFVSGGQPVSLDLRLQMGRQWLKMIRDIGDFRDGFISKYKIEVPDPDDDKFAHICAHKESWAQFAAVAERSMDGAALYFYLKEADTNHAYDGIGVPAGDETKIDQAAEKFISWFESMYLQPTSPENNAWAPKQMEYQFACAAPVGDAEKVMVAEEYYHGHLDWYNLDIDTDKDNLGEPEVPPPAVDKKPLVESFIPVPLGFEGMPDTRWWKFEDSGTNFGDIKPDTTDLNKLLLIEFGLIYSNDWFLFPLTLDAGCIANVRGMTVTNVFGERIWIDAAGSGPDDAWQRWSMYTINKKGVDDQKADTSILILPTTGQVLEGKPMEEINMVRDEVANMVWGIEKKVPLSHGKSKPGREAAIERHNHLQKILDKKLDDGTLAPPVVPVPKANIRYEVMNTVPENWIPFIPVHKEGSNRETELQRASLPRILNNLPPDKFEKIKPRTNLLREGLDKAVPEAYFVHEEEVPRAGTVLRQSFQRSRWYNGKVITWLGVRKTTGRGEGSSGLAYDRIVPTDRGRSNG